MIGQHWLTRRRRSVVVVIMALMLAGVLQLADVNPASSQGLSLTAYSAYLDPGMDPESSVWRDGSPLEVPLTAQAGVYTAGGSVPVVSVKALHYAGKLYLRAEWADSTLDEVTTRVEDFSDAVAVELPARSASSVPSICMGQADAGVNIWQWRADSQRGVLDPNVAYQNALVDGYPSDDPIFYTARAAGNPFARPELGAVQTLVSRTFGALTTAAVQDVEGKGVHADGRWAVVFVRDFSGADAEQAEISLGATTDVAFAVWDGSKGERNGRKSVSTFVRLDVSAESPPRASIATPLTVGLGLVVIIALAGFGVSAARRSRPTGAVEG